jgi:hypothetical protein
LFFYQIFLGGYRMVEQLSHSDLSGVVGQLFVMNYEMVVGVDEKGTEQVEQESLSLLLESVSELKRSGPYDQFSIIFRGPCDPLLPQQTYYITHEDLGEHGVFLVPICRDGDGVLYEAIFSRLTEPGE